MEKRVMTGFISRILPLLSFAFIFLFPNDFPDQQSQEISNSEIGFVVYSQNTYYGLNLDNSQGEIRFRIETNHNKNVLFIDQNIEDVYYTVAATNDHGAFIAYYPYLETNNPIRLSPTQFDKNFGKLLFESSSVPLRKEINLSENPLIIDNSNQLLADENQNAYIIETINGVSKVIPSQNPYEILTAVNSYSDITNMNNDFFHPFQQKIRVENEIKNNINNFSLNNGFDVLKKAQPIQDVIASIIIDPNRNQIFLSFDKDFEKIWMINLDGGTIETFAGFEKYHKGNMPDIGITANDLRILNFSNEGLMIRIIFGAIGILIIILATVLLNIRDYKLQ